MGQSLIDFTAQISPCCVLVQSVLHACLYWSHQAGSLGTFLLANDTDVYGRRHPTLHQSNAIDKRAIEVEHSSPLHSLQQYVTLHVINNFDNVAALHSYLDDLNLLDANRLRPSWDSYFMVNSRDSPITQEMTHSSRLWLPSLQWDPIVWSDASVQSLCGTSGYWQRGIYIHSESVSTHWPLILSYNGTPLGLTNCNEGGCTRCNGSDECESCLCLHAEENALLEAGRERVEGATLYCNT